MDHPPTIIVIHPKERRSKCTVEPLRPRSEFIFWKFPKYGSESLDGYVQLGVDGPPLSADDALNGLLVLDGTWRLVERMQPDFTEIPVRSLPGWTTAYPRVSKLFADPSAGLATIEAIFAAFTMLGRDTDGLLDSYYWSAQFLEQNAALIAQYAG